MGQNTGFNCEAARDKVSEYLDQIQDSRTTTDDDITVGYTTKKFINTGLDGWQFRDQSKKYKEAVKVNYIRLQKSYVLLETCTPELKKKLTAPIEYNKIVFNKPLKDYKMSELTDHAINAFKFKLQDTPQSYNPFMLYCLWFSLGPNLINYLREIIRLNLLNDFQK